MTALAFPLFLLWVIPVGVIAGMILLVVVIALINRGPSRYYLKHPPPEYCPVTPKDIDDKVLLQHFTEALGFPTITHCEDRKPWNDFHEWLRDTYPLMHSSPNIEYFCPSNHSLVYIWKGTDSSLKPVGLAGHQDVVSPGDVEKWRYPPFGGVVKDGYVWGRGTLDDKSNLISLFEAIEWLLHENFRPSRTVILMSSDEEEMPPLVQLYQKKQSKGHFSLEDVAKEMEGRPLSGAASIVEAVKNRGYADFEFVIDEGTPIAEGMIPGLNEPVALLGLAEKSYFDVELTVNANTGHAAFASPHESCPAKLSAAVSKVLDSPLPVTGLDAGKPSRQMLTTAAPLMGPFMRTLLSNIWLFKPLVIRQFKKNQLSFSAISSIIAVSDLVSSSPHYTVFPSKGRAFLKVRAIPGTEMTTEVVRRHLSRVIGDSSVNISVYCWGSDNSITNPNSWGYGIIAEASRRIFNHHVIPSFLPAGSDCMSYSVLSDTVIRHSPFMLKSEDAQLPHNVDERIKAETFPEMVRFYRELIALASM